MRSTNRKRTLIVSGAVILLCMTVIIGMTWALFTDTQKVKNHLVAGDLDITLERVELTKKTLTAKGYLKSTTYTGTDAYEDFTNTTDPNKNVFGLETDGQGTVTELIVPGSEFVSTMKITNNSDAAFKYWVKIVCNDADKVVELAEQLIITVYTDKNGDGTIDTDDTDGTTEGDVSIVKNGLAVGSDLAPIGTLGIGDSENFIVSVEFDDKGYSYVGDVLTSDNDVTQGQDVEFDLIVYAVQETDAP